jgi:hypothetical protein
MPALILAVYRGVAIPYREHFMLGRRADGLLYRSCTTLPVKLTPSDRTLGGLRHGSDELAW